MTAISKGIIKISGRDFIVKQDMVLSTFSLKKEIGEEIIIPVMMAFDEKDNIILKECSAKVLVTNNYKNKKVTTFKMKNRTRARRTKSSRAHLTQIKITSLTIGGK